MGIIAEFLGKVTAIYKTGAATEHSYRSAIEFLFHSLDNAVTPLNEPKRVACGAPDFIIQRGEIAIGHVEAKDIPIGIRNFKDSNKDQQQRYLKALPNLIYTNCLDFDFYRNGERIASVSIGDFLMGIQPKPDQFDALEHLLRDFLAQRPQTITSPKTLAEIMAGKAGLIKDIMTRALMADEAQETELSGQFKAFQQYLIHDITKADFADIYAETIAYGMFAARLHDTTLDTFSRVEALELLPKSNPFLRSLFSYIAGPDLDDRIRWVIDDLANVFQAANVQKIMAGFGKLTGQKDPFLHFYETFLAAYNPAKRKARGVWYTPEPVVNFIVRAVDEVLQTEFGLPDGLADTSKITIDWDTGQTKNAKAVTIKKEVHRVQILDPATGTGTFLAEVIKQIAPKIKDVAEGMWSPYIEKDLIPRLHGFELLMASYAMCHMKLDMILTEMGYKPTSTPPRLGVYLTNSLEEGEAANQSLPFAQWLSNEVKQANTIKRDMPIMCVIGNPPYSGISQNNGEFISGLIEDYKYVDGKHFNERKHWLQDDYVKFIRLSESLIAKTGEGILGFISNHGYLGNPTFRGMRHHLLKTFDKIYVLDLHGNANKKETSSDGKPDKNVFDIRQGVSIIVAVKKKCLSSKKPASVFHAEIQGGRNEKYEALWRPSKELKRGKEIEPRTPYYMFYPIDAATLERYDRGISLDKLMPVNQKGVITARDHLAIAFSREELSEQINKFVDPKKNDDQVRSEFFPGKKQGKYFPGDTRGWKLPDVRKALLNLNITNIFCEIDHRPFDRRVIANSQALVDWPREKFMANFLNNENIGILFNRGVEEQRPFSDVFISQNVVQHHSLSLKEANNIAPLYIYPSELELDQTRRVNFDHKLYKKLQKLAMDVKRGAPDEMAVFDYIYGVLHCPAYRETYAEFLKIDFPRIPWPTTPDEFWDISIKGTELRKLHLMDPAAIGPTPYPFKGEGDAIVEKPHFEDGKVWINATQYFDAAPDVSWGFYIGGYQPAQKWLKDRKGRALNFDDVKHYQRILKILSETDRIMKTITMNLQ